MSRTVRVKYERGILRLLDDAEFREGEELEIIVVKRSFGGSGRRQADTGSR